MDFKTTIKRYIRKNQLLSEKGKYLVALSGGADSVALLLILKDLGYALEACHCNFHLRGEESDRDEEFCVNLCQQTDIPLHRIHFDTKTYAEVHKVSIEMAARDLRYHYFEQLMIDTGASGICVAHHQDDSVETVLINLIRGTGIKGLTGISPQNGNIIRPLLCIGKADILRYLAEKQQNFVTDSTNLVDDVVRNKIRLNIIPMLKEINPAVCDNIAKTAAHLQEAQKMLDAFDSRMKPRRGNYGFTYIDKEQVAKSPSMEYILHKVLSPYGLGNHAAEEVIRAWKATGKTWESPSHLLANDRTQLVIKEKGMPFHTLVIPETGNYTLPPKSVLKPWEQEECGIEDYLESLENEQRFKLGITPKDKGFAPSRERFSITLDADKVAFPLTLRQARQGDTFHPFGMKGNKLISDYLTDRKKNVFEKDAQLVLADKNGLIVWVVGERTSEDCKVGEATKEILSISVL